MNTVERIGTLFIDHLVEYDEFSMNKAITGSLLDRKLSLGLALSDAQPLNPNASSKFMP